MPERKKQLFMEHDLFATSYCLWDHRTFILSVMRFKITHQSFSFFLRDQPTTLRLCTAHPLLGRGGAPIRCHQPGCSVTGSRLERSTPDALFVRGKEASHC